MTTGDRWPSLGAGGRLGGGERRQGTAGRGLGGGGRLRGGLRWTASLATGRGWGLGGGRRLWGGVLWRTATALLLFVHYLSVNFELKLLAGELQTTSSFASAYF